MIDGLPVHLVEILLRNLPPQLVELREEVGERSDLVVAERVLRYVGVPAAHQVRERSDLDTLQVVVEGHPVDDAVVVAGPAHVPVPEYRERLLDGVRWSASLLERVEFERLRIRVVRAQHPPPHGATAGNRRWMEAEYQPSIGNHRERRVGDDCAVRLRRLRLLAVTQRVGECPV
jgi:hypothetical protein